MIIRLEGLTCTDLIHVRLRFKLHFFKKGDVFRRITNTKKESLQELINLILYPGRNQTKGQI